LSVIDPKNPLEQIIRDRIQETGGIPFRDFMELCLYHPEHGYYMNPRERIGKEGDFFTSSSVHALFGNLIARQLRQMAELLGGGSFTIVEQGSGNGELAADILDALAEEAPDLYRWVRYRLVDISPAQRRRQEKTLERHRERVDWCDLEDAAGFKGCFLSNELVDAFPVHRIRVHEGRLEELFVVLKDGELAEEFRQPSVHALQAHFDWLGISSAEGNLAEVNLAAVHWMKKVAGLLEKGFVLTIDYGYPAVELFSPLRRTGTLMCYRQHTTVENPYEELGGQDMTAHVDFTALEKAGSGAGLDRLFYGPQYRFLLGLGFVEALLDLQTRENDEKKARALRLTLKNLILPDGGMGDTFKVLVQGKGMGRPDLLCARPLGSLAFPSERA